MLHSIRQWILNNFREIELALVIFAAILAVWPIWQWLAEKDDRQLNRRATLVQSAAVCDELWFSHQDREAILKKLEKTLGSEQIDLNAWRKDQYVYSYLCADVITGISEMFPDAVARWDERIMTPVQKPQYQRAIEFVPAWISNFYSCRLFPIGCPTPSLSFGYPLAPGLGFWPGGHASVELAALPARLRQGATGTALTGHCTAYHPPGCLLSFLDFLEAL